MRDDAIRLARVPHRLAGGPRLRSGLERWLADCDPARHGLPAQAIVLVRRLRTHWSEVAADDRAARYGSFAALLDGARRPAAGDSDADVVWFADEAELLACIARDALTGVLRARWWWRALGPGLAPSPPGVARWLQAPRQVPRAIGRLGPARAAAWLASWTAPEQAGLLAALAQAFPVTAAVAAWVLEGRVQQQAAVPPAPQAVPAHAAGAKLSAADIASGSSTAERLQQLCTELAVDAGAARAPESAARLAASLAARATRAAQPAPQFAQVAASAMPQTTARGRPGEPMAAPRSPRAMASLQAASRPDGATASALALPAAGGPPARAATVPVNLRGPVPRSMAHLPLQAIAPAPVDDSAALTDPPPCPALATRHGGLFFVLNAALQMRLYGDFTVPSHQGLACPPWQFLWLAGRAWCGPAFGRDPLAGWLARRQRVRATAAQRAALIPLWPCLHARLALALEDGTGLPPRRRVASMLNLPAQLRDGGERLDLDFALDALPLAVRLAGLDRDPGWIPAAGCDFRFHFG